MTRTIDYYFSLNSPWTYLGGLRLVEIAERHGAAINYRPVDLGKVFPATGGLPLAKRAPARQAYRLQELARWSTYLGMPLNVHPAHFPYNEWPAAGMVVAARQQSLDCGRLSNAILRGVWAEERNMADIGELSAVAAGIGLDGDALLAAAETEPVAVEYAADTAEALKRGVFGAPTYAIGEALFWGQDRLEFVERELAGA